ncbi:hypothetical protein U9M48_015323 [Paspalum notatum var. saurae]|uniref:Uncharacterized protein n=1 Tax=Paspalum notatum var. saurae TaxID=547442 RepID=A0AAQ3T694_PASNO
MSAESLSPPLPFPISDPKTLEQASSQAAAMSAERKEREAFQKDYFERTAWEKMLGIAKLEEEKLKHGIHPALPPLEMLNFPDLDRKVWSRDVAVEHCYLCGGGSPPVVGVKNSDCLGKGRASWCAEDLLGRAWGWDSLIPYFSVDYWAQYKAYLHLYYTRNHPKVSNAGGDSNLNGDDENGLGALAASCIKREEELMLMIKRRPKLFNADDEISLSNKITRCAHEMSGMKCSEFPAAAVALKCIEKEADLMCELVIYGCTTSDVMLCGKIRKHALSFMTYKGPEHVAASATMMATAKEANLICEIFRNYCSLRANDYIWCKTIRRGAFRAMLKIFDESAAEESTVGKIAQEQSAESDEENHSKNELVQNDNVQGTEKINQETEAENSRKEDDMEGNYLDENEEPKVEVESVIEDEGMN